MKKLFITLMVLSICTSIVSCKTMTKSLVLGGTLGAMSTAGTTSAVYYKNRTQGAIAGGLVGLGLGIWAASYIFSENQTQKQSDISKIKDQSKAVADRKIHDAIESCVSSGNMRKPELKATFVDSTIKGGKFIGPRIDWTIQDDVNSVTPESQSVVENAKKDTNK